MAAGASRRRRRPGRRCAERYASEQVEGHDSAGTGQKREQGGRIQGRAVGPRERMRIALGEYPEPLFDRRGHVVEQKAGQRRLPFHHPDQDALDGDQSRRMRADVKRILVANPLGVVRHKLPGVADCLLAGDLEVAGRTRKVVRRGPFGEVISGGRSQRDYYLDGDRRRLERDQPCRFRPA